MPHGEAPTLPSEPGAPGEDRARLVRRLELLCGLAEETAGVVDPDDVWRILQTCAAEVLDADAVALHAPSLPQPLAWTADGGEDERAALVALAEEDGDQLRPVQLPGGGAGLLVPLRYRGETLGALVAGMLLSAHLIIFWLSQDSNVTPPVCLAAFAAAGIAGTRPMATDRMATLAPTASEMRAP